MWENPFFVDSDKEKESRNSPGIPRIWALQLGLFVFESITPTPESVLKEVDLGDTDKSVLISQNWFVATTLYCKSLVIFFYPQVL